MAVTKADLVAQKNAAVQAATAIFEPLGLVNSAEEIKIVIDGVPVEITSIGIEMVMKVFVDGQEVEIDHIEIHDLDMPIYAKIIPVEA